MTVKFENKISLLSKKIQIASEGLKNKELILKNLNSNEFNYHYS